MSQLYLRSSLEIIQLLSLWCMEMRRNQLRLTFSKKAESNLLKIPVHFTAMESDHAILG